jgi:hypothetical protein
MSGMGTEQFSFEEISAPQPRDAREMEYPFRDG